jgi:hypothetical protein
MSSWFAPIFDAALRNNCRPRAAGFAATQAMPSRLSIHDVNSPKSLGRNALRPIECGYGRPFVRNRRPDPRAQ